jgi:hypothetical protein
VTVGIYNVKSFQGALPRTLKNTEETEGKEVKGGERGGEKKGRKGSRTKGRRLQFFAPGRKSCSRRLCLEGVSDGTYEVLSSLLT